MHAVFATFLALRDREKTGDGHLVEVTMIEAALNAAAEQVVEYGASGKIPERQGNRGPMAAPQNVYACAGEEEWIAIAVATDEQWESLREVLGDAEWAADDALAAVEGRRAAHDAIDTHLAKWCSEQDARELTELLASRGIPAGYVVDSRDIAKNPQLLHRGYFEVEHHPVSGEHPIPMVPFRFASVTSWLRRPSPLLGEHNDEVLGGILGLTDDELTSLRAANVIGNRPVGT
jgi:crotonobetainyl-CoA:carnitine CoA-transferase CaiB-like acyl-CoA transferase